MAKRNTITPVIAQGIWTVCYYVFLLLFGAGIWLINLASLPVALLPRTTGGRTLRSMIHGLARVYVAVMERSGALVSNRDVLTEIATGKGGMLIIANHPSILDAPIILSRVPGISCVFKSALKQSLLMPLTARTAGYLSNDTGLQLLRDLESQLMAGARVLLFPEGTRTTAPLLNPFNSSYALAAIRSAVPVQLLTIQTDSPILTKRQHFLRAGRFPVRFRLALGPRIEPGEFVTVRTMNSQVESWYRKAMGSLVSLRPFLPLGATVEAGKDSCEAQFKVPQGPFYCDGHMPGNPIVPGYVQMAWAREVVGMSFPVRAGMLEYHRWKFLQPVRPGADICLQAVTRDGQWICTISGEGGKLSQGRLSLSAQPANLLNLGTPDS